MKKIMIGLTMGIILVTTMGQQGCSEKKAKTPDADLVQQMQTKQALSEANREIGMPAIVNYQERKWAKMIFELRDQSDLITYAYIVDWQGNFHFVGRCVGFGLPYSVQYTNPLKIFDTEREGGASSKYEDNGEIQVLPQADPNGLFMPDGLSATWLLLINEETGEPQPVYFEPTIVVSPFPLHKLETNNE